MQSPPAYEGMYLHGILHRIEGDYDNARAWYGNAKSSDAFKAVWGEAGEKEALRLIEEIEGLRKRDEGDIQDLERRSLDEIKRVTGFCEEKFGTGEVKDAILAEAWVAPDEKHKQIGNDMVSGGEGWRDF